MAKRSKSGGGIRRGEPTSTGIYRTATDSASFADIGAVKQLFEEADFDVTFDDILDGIEQAAAEVLSPHVPDGQPPWALPRTFPSNVKPHEIEQAKDAQRLLLDARAIRKLIADGGKLERVAYHAFTLGQRAERMGVREFEPHAARGRVVREAASAGGNAKNAEHAAMRAQYQADVEAKMATSKRISFTEAQRQVAKQHGVSFATVRRYTEKPTRKISAK